MEPVNSGSGSDNSGGVSESASKTVTDFLGVTRTLTKDGSVWTSNDGYTITDSQMARYDKTVTGYFTYKSVKYHQEYGVAFNMTLIQNQKIQYDSASNFGYKAEMYNGDASKLSLEIQQTVNTVNTYTKDGSDKKPVTLKFVMKDGMRLARLVGDVVTTTNDSLTSKTIWFYSKYDAYGMGFVKGDVNIKVKYDGHEIGTYTFTANSDANASGLSPVRQTCMELAQAAVSANGGSKGYVADMAAIVNYIRDNFGYYDSYGNLSIMDCISGMMTLETWSVYKYGVYGFAGPGGYGAYADHVAFHLDSDPNTYYETAGTK